MNTVAPDWLWAFFIASVLVALFVDFVVLRKQGAHEVTVPEAIKWSVIWVALSFAFNALFWWALKTHDDPAVAAEANTRAVEFLTGYLIEKSLAVDNIFVFLMIFTYFAVPPAYQKRVLMIGIVGAIVLRTVMILVGGLLIGLALEWFGRTPDELLRLLLVTGFLGGLTTFSSFSGESLALLQRGEFSLALTHTLAHVLGSLLAAAAGLRLMQWLLD